MARATGSTRVAGGSFTVTVQGVDDVLRDLRRLDKDASAELRDESQRLSQVVASRLRAAAASSPTPQAAAVAESIRTPRDRFVKVTVGGTKRVGRAYRERGRDGKRGRLVRASAGALLSGSEYGSHAGTDSAGRAYTSRFVAGHNASGYWIGPTWAKAAPDVIRAWLAALDRLLNREGWE